MKPLLPQMLTKSQKFIAVSFGALLCFFFAACSTPNSAMINVPQNQNLAVNNENTKTLVSNTKSSGTLDCGKPNEYSFVVVENPNRKNAADPVMPKDLNIVIGKEIVAKIELPIADSEARFC